MLSIYYGYWKLLCFSLFIYFLFFFFLCKFYSCRWIQGPVVVSLNRTKCLNERARSMVWPFFSFTHIGILTIIFLWLTFFFSFLFSLTFFCCCCFCFCYIGEFFMSIATGATTEDIVCIGIRRIEVTNAKLFCFNKMALKYAAYQVLIPWV